MKKFASLAAVTMFFALTGAAHAFTLPLDVDLNLSTLTYSTGGSYSPNIDLSAPPPGTSLVRTGDAHVLPAISFPNVFKQPAAPLFDNHYLAVIHNPGPPGTATFNLATGDNTFAFTWGSIDSYNTLVLTMLNGGKTVTYDVTGSAILGQIAGSISGTTQANVEFVDPIGTIVSAEFETTQNSFEVANFYNGKGDPAPLPPALLLFGSALLGLLVFARRNKQSARADG